MNNFLDNLLITAGLLVSVASICTGKDTTLIIGMLLILMGRDRR